MTVLQIGRLWVVVLGLSLTSAAHARDRVLRDFCADRPGKGTPPCILDPGHIQTEMSLVDFVRDRSPRVLSNTILIGDLFIRAGLTDATELRIGWTPFGIFQMRDLATSGVMHNSGVGDVMLGFRTNLKSPDGSGVSIAVQPSVSLAVGGSAIGAGAWGVSLVVPMSFQLKSAIQFALTPEVDAAPNADGSGRHVRYGGVVGVGIPMTSTIAAGVELAAFRNDDPLGHVSNATADVTLAWTPKANPAFQFDAGAYVGLNDHTPEVEIVLGVAKRF